MCFFIKYEKRRKGLGEDPQADVWYTWCGRWLCTSVTWSSTCFVRVMSMPGRETPIATTHVAKGNSDTLFKSKKKKINFIKFLAFKTHLHLYSFTLFIFYSFFFASLLSCSFKFQYRYYCVTQRLFIFYFFFSSKILINLRKRN